MSIVRIERYSRFTNVPNEAIEDDRLSFRARGILVYLLSKPDTWDARSEQLIDAGREGREAIRAAMRELKEFGYMEHIKEQYVADNGKKLWRTIVVVRDLPPEAFRGTGFRSSEDRPSETQALTAKTEKQTLSSKAETTTSSPSSRARSARRAHDDGPDKSALAEINDALRPGTRPLQQTRRVTRGRKAPAEHIHAPQRRNAGGLACYWAEALEKVGSLEANEEAIVGRFFKEWMSRGLDVRTGRMMIEVFFADPELVGSSHRWRRFVSNAETIRSRCIDVMGYDPESGDFDMKVADDDAHAWLEELGASA
jgi:hypothetical protein